MIRRKFIEKLALLTTLPLFVSLLGCEEDEASGGESANDSTGEDTSDDSGDDGGDGTPSACASTAAVTEYLNPGHDHGTLGLTPAEVAAADTSLDYQLMDGSHTHTYNLTAQDFTDLQDGLSVELTADLQGHGHRVEISC